MKIIGVIPARYASSRFPGKPLIEIAGVPLVIRVARKVEEALDKENTYIATDDDRIKKLAEDYGYNTVMTSSDHYTGTDRLYEVSQKVKADIIINVQGDEPVINPDDILRIAEVKKSNMDMVINGYYPISDTEDPKSVNIPKVVISSTEQLIYMSRLAVPGFKDADKAPDEYYKQVCIYAFTAEELELFGTQTNKAPCENSEDIEILRFLDLGYPVKMVKTSGVSLAVDTPEDVETVEKFISDNE